MAQNFYIQPGGDLTGGLTGLSSIVANIGEEKEKRRLEAEKQQYMQDAQVAAREAYRSGDPDLMMEVGLQYPEYFEQVEKGVAAKTGIKNDERIALSREILANPENAENAFIKRIQTVSDRGGDPSDSMRALEEYRQNPEAKIKEFEMFMASMDKEGYEAYKASKGQAGNAPSEIQVRDRLLADINSPDEAVRQSARIGLGLDAPAARASANIQMIGGVPYMFDPRTQTMQPVSVNGDQITADTVAADEATIAEGKKFAEMTGSSRATAIDKGLDTIQSIDSNIRNLDLAYQALEDGAQSGPIISKYTPTLKESTQRLENARNKLGLDIVSAVTFGALSEGELNLALTTAMPQLPPAELKTWIRNSQAAQRKLKDYYMEQIDWLDNGGTVASFLRNKRRQSESKAAQQAPAQDSVLTYNPETGEFE